MAPRIVNCDTDLPCNREIEREQVIYNINEQVGWKIPNDYSHLPDAVADYKEEDKYYKQIAATEAEFERACINSEILRQDAEEDERQKQCDIYVAEYNAMESARKLADKIEMDLCKNEDVRRAKLDAIKLYRFTKAYERREAHKFDDFCAMMDEQISLEEKNKEE